MDWNPGSTKQETKEAGAAAGTSFEDKLQNIDRDKGMAMLAYILFFVPLLTGDANRSPFIKYHTNQGAVLLIAAIIFSLALGVVTVFFKTIFAFLAFVNPLLFGSLGILIGLLNVLGFAPVIFAILGIINVANDEMKPLPFIGHYTIIK